MKARVLIPAVALGLTAGTASAQVTVIEVFNEAQAANGEFAVDGTFLDTVAVADGTAFAVSRQNGATAGGVVTAFDGSSFTTVMTPAQFLALGSTFDIAAGNGAGVVGGSGGVLRAVSFFDNNVYEVNLGTGAVTEVVSSATIDAATGVSSNLGAAHETASDGTIYGLESVSDVIVGISPGNAASVEIGAGDFATLVGGTSVGGIGIQGGNILIGSNSNDTLLAWDVTGNTGSTVLTTAQIDAVTDDVDGVVSFGDIFFAPDGLVYFYEGDSDFLLSYDPADPAGTIGAVITEADFIAGPSSDTINQLSWWNGNIAFTDGSIGFYTIPEPTTAALIGLGGLAMLRRRRSA